MIWCSWWSGCAVSAPPPSPRRRSTAGRRMGLTLSEMIDVVCALTPRQLYKSMTTLADSTVWQDVYHAHAGWSGLRQAHASAGRGAGHSVQGSLTVTKTCRHCGSPTEAVPFENETHAVDYRGRVVEVTGLSGMRCPECGEVEFDAESAARYAAAGDALVLAARKAAGDELRRIRKKLRLNQAEASKLTGGGHNAFSRYETGKKGPRPRRDEPLPVASGSPSGGVRGTPARSGGVMAQYPLRIVRRT